MGITRIAEPRDGAAVAAIYAPYVQDTPISFEETAPSAHEMSARIESILATHPFLVFEEEEAVVAYAYASSHSGRAAYRWSCNVGIYAAPQVHRRGIGRT